MRASADVAPMRERLPLRALIAVMLSASIAGMSMSFTYPLVAIVLERLGHGPFVIGLNAAVQAVAMVIVAPFLGRLCYRFGARRCMAFGLALLILATVMLPQGETLTHWFVWRFALGLGTVFPFALSEAGVNALTHERVRGRVIGVYATLFCIGFASGPLLLRLTGTAGPTPFYAAALILALAALPILFAGELDRRLSGAPRLTLRQAVRAASFALTAVAVFGLIENSFFALMPRYAFAHGYDANTAANLLAVLIVGNTLLQVPIGLLADRLPRRLVLLLVSVVALVGLLALPLASGHLAVLYPLLLLLGGVAGGIYTVALMLIGEDFTGTDLVVAGAVFVIFYDLGAIIGPSLAGLAMSGIGAIGLPLVLASALGIFALAVAWHRRRHPPVPRH